MPFWDRPKDVDDFIERERKLREEERRRYIEEYQRAKKPVGIFSIIQYESRRHIMSPL
ncbi:MAG: hypothetical protein MN733_36535 [Nitrososphaera sp.]|nr:hypothetical protein [Nitrososphaera sp.]